MSTPISLPKPLLLALFSGLLLSPMAGCDQPEAKDPAADEQSEQDKMVAERVRKKREERAAKKKAEEDAAEAQAKAIDAIAVLPDEKDMPKKLDKACKAVSQANDDFMLRLYEGDALTRWNKIKGGQLSQAEAGCNTLGSLEVAACEINAMNAAGPELKKAFPKLKDACIEKFGAGAEQAKPG